MPRMKFADIVSRVKDVSNVTSKDDLIKQGIQRGFDIATSRDLPYLDEEAFIKTIAPDSTGTVSVTAGSKTVTGSGTSWTSLNTEALLKIRVGGNNEYYRVASIGGDTSITLDMEYQGSTESGASFSLYKDEYRLAPDADAIKIMRELENETALVDIEPSTFSILEPSPQTEGMPNFSIVSGSKLDTYTTGTVTGSANSASLTGSSTAWEGVEGLGRGTRLTIGTNVYTVKSVDSDTAITLYEKLSSAASADSYSVNLDNLIMQFYRIPDEAYPIRYKYQRLSFPLYNDEDIPDMPDNWIHILVTSGLVWAWATKDKEESKAQAVIFQALVNDFWARVASISKNRIIPRRSQDIFFGYPNRMPRIGTDYGVPIKLI